MISDERSQTISLLLFRAGGLGYGVFSSQINSSNLSVPDANKILNGLPWKSENDGREKFVLNYCHFDGFTYEIPIDAVEELVETPIKSISPLPRFIENQLLDMGLWGILVRRGKIFILIDLERLACRAEE